MTRWGKASTSALCVAVAISLGGSALAGGCDSGDLTANESPYSNPNIHPVFGEDPAYAIVNYSDLDLGSPRGAKVMLQRLHRATEIACHPRPFIGSFTDWDYWNYCVNSRMHMALNRLGSPMVTAAYAEERSSRREGRWCP